MSKSRRFSSPFYWKNTDVARIVYYVTYPRIFNQGHNNLARKVDIDQAEFLDNQSVTFAVYQYKNKHLQPAQPAEEFKVWPHIRKLGGTSIDRDQDINRGDEPVVRDEIRSAIVKSPGRQEQTTASIRQARNKFPIIS